MLSKVTGGLRATLTLLSRKECGLGHPAVALLSRRVSTAMTHVDDGVEVCFNM